MFSDHKLVIEARSPRSENKKNSYLKINKCGQLRISVLNLLTLSSLWSGI